jgi:mRNA-degrading endonuclease RelE of RelBE toxin-antitoxin system
MYQVEDEGRWAGLRRLYVGEWKVFYSVWEPTSAIYIEIIVHAKRADPDESES